MPDIIELERADIVPAKQDLALLRVVQARYELKDCTLPGTVLADNDLSS